MGLDQSLTSTGVVIADISTNLRTSEPHIEIEVKEAIKTEKVLEDYIPDTLFRGTIIANRLLALIAANNVQAICFESLSLGSKGNATRTLPMLLGIILAKLSDECFVKGIKTYHVAPKSLKKLATGNGNAGKKEMYAQLEVADPELHQWLDNQPINIGRYDIVDAYFLMKEGYNLHTKTIGK